MDKNTLLRLYQELGSVSAVARHFGLTPSAMRWHYKRHGIETKRGYKSPKNVRYYGEEHYNWKGGTYESGGYRRIYAPDHPNNAGGYVLEHRLVVEKHLGRYLYPTEVVHHINGDKLDNRLENLIVLTRTEHMQLHKSESDRDEKGRFAG